MCFKQLSVSNISRQNLWKDGIHLNVGNILAENFISCVNKFVLNKSHSFWLKELSAQRSDPSAKDIIIPISTHWGS